MTAAVAHPIPRTTRHVSGSWRKIRHPTAEIKTNKPTSGINTLPETSGIALKKVIAPTPHIIPETRGHNAILGNSLNFPPEKFTAQNAATISIYPKTNQSMEICQAIRPETAFKIMLYTPQLSTVIAVNIRQSIFFFLFLKN
jgi:hypothetical protein